MYYGDNGSKETLVKLFTDSNNELVTKDCINPWNLAFVDASGDIKPCFVTKEKLGHINDPQSISEILNNEINQNYRKTLLSGKLKNVCKNCHCIRLDNY